MSEPKSAIAAAAPDSPDKKTELAAVRLLARREHGVEELRRKLLSKGHERDAVDRVLDKLQAKRLVSDDRFAATLVHHHAKRGQGPVRIRAQLRQQGLKEEVIEENFAGVPTDWRQLASEVRRRKFGNSLPKTAAERAKQARFLQYRGFNADQIRAALQSDEHFDVSDSGADTDSI